MGNEYDPINLFPETYNYDECFENEESTNTTSSKNDKDDSVDFSLICHH